MKTTKNFAFNRTAARAPQNLSAESQKFWKEIVAEYAIEDPAGLKLLQRACESLDRLKNAQALIAKDGEVIRDKKGSVKAHPACAIEKDSHKQFIESLKALNLDLEPLRDKPGRPPGK